MHDATKAESSPLPLSRSDLADLIGVQSETTSRLFKRLKIEGEFVISGCDIQMPIPFPIQQVVNQSPESTQRNCDPDSTKACRGLMPLL